MRKPKFLEEMDLPTDYYAEPNPYEGVKSANIDLLELSRYARRNDKKLVELSREEVQRFETKIKR